LPNLLSNYSVRPPWQVAGVDYHVGLPQGMALNDPTVAANLPAGVTLSPGSHLLIVHANNVTISGFDFSGNGGYGIYINPGVSGTTITNNLFVDSTPTSPIPVNIGAGASNTTITYNTMDGGGLSGNQTFDEMIYNLGSNLTVQYNYIKDAPGRFVTTSNGSLVDQYNLFQDGGFLPGVHLNFLQFVNGNISSAQVDYNTLVQDKTLANGEGIQMYMNGSGSISNGDIGNNTMVSTGTPVEAGVGGGPAISYWLHAGSNGQYSSPASGSIHNNYIDASSAYGAVYPGLSGFPSAGNNVNLVTGAQF